MSNQLMCGVCNSVAMLFLHEKEKRPNLTPKELQEELF